jgi:glycogen debranching enzyme
MAPKDKNYFWVLGRQAIQTLETETGILASGSNELYGCIFGRDSLITALKLLRIGKARGNDEFLPLVRKILLNLIVLQGKEVNIESGEEPGKCIHEFRPSGHEHLTKNSAKPWYVYPDAVMRNYDSVDATSLLLIALFRFWQASCDSMFLDQVMPAVRAALAWQMSGDSNGDGFIDYEFSEARTSGGLVTQSWMDSQESVFFETESNKPIYPLAPVEVQAYAYMAYRLWAGHFAKVEPDFAAMLNQRADTLKRLFNEKYPTEDPDGNIYLAFKLDGNGQALRSVRSNMGHVLWASLNREDDGVVDCILSPELVPSVVARLMMHDMFEPKAGIRTLSTLSDRYQPNSYHNGSIWPHDNALIAEGFEIHGFYKEAQKIYDAILSAIGEFETPIELFVYENSKFKDYLSVSGQGACRIQAWSAAAILDAAARV